MLEKLPNSCNSSLRSFKQREMSQRCGFIVGYAVHS